MPQTTDDANTMFDRVIRPWWAKIAIWFLMCAIAVWTYSLCAAVDAGERSADSITKAARVLYSIGGTWLAAGVPFGVGAAFIGWGIYQLTRLTPFTPGEHADATPARDGDEPVREFGYAQSLYFTFWRPVFTVVAVINVGVAFLIVRAAADEAGTYAYVVALLIAIAAAFFELHAFERAMDWSEGPPLDFSQRMTWIGIIGYGLAIALAVGLAIGQSSDAASAEQQKQERDAYYERLRDPDIQRGMEALREMQRKKTPPADGQ
jgi:hypothetical protein